MKNTLISLRNRFFHGAYILLLKPLFFLRDPEIVHDGMIAFGSWLGKYSLFRWKTRMLFDYRHPALRQKILGITFSNPIGLSAGFDKNAELTQILPSVGFGFEEVGSITASPCAGNPKPRLWRLPQSKGLVVYYGLKNDGAEALAGRLSKKQFAYPLGISIAMTNCEENLDRNHAIADYAFTLKRFEDIGSYVTINISCPNTCGGQPFLEPEALDALLSALDALPKTKPRFIKLSPDLSYEVVDVLLDIAKKYHIDGVICTNLTKKRDNPLILEKEISSHGGISGLPVQALSNDLISYIYRREKDRFIIMGSGGVFSAEDAYKKIRLGASLIQMITGMIFEGPQVISEINRGLVNLLRRDGFTNIKDVIGIDA